MQFSETVYCMACNMFTFVPIMRFCTVLITRKAAEKAAQIYAHKYIEKDAPTLIYSLYFLFKRI